MTGSELRRIRQALGLSIVEMGREFGYQGNDNSVSVTLREYERGKAPIPDWIAEEAVSLARG